MQYVYVLQSGRDNKFYTGYTKNLKLRFEQHQKGLAESTKNRRLLKLVYYLPCGIFGIFHRVNMFKSARCYTPRKIFKNLSWENVYQE